MAMQNNSFGGPNCEPLALNSRHALAAALRAIGHTQAEIAQMIGVSASHIAVLCTSDLFKAEVKRIEAMICNRTVDDTVQLLMSQTRRSVETIIDIRDNINNSPTVRLRASDTILNKVPATSNATRVQSIPNSNLQLTDEQTTYLMTALNDDPKAKDAFHRAANRSMLEMTEVDDLPEGSGLLEQFNQEEN